MVFGQVLHFILCHSLTRPCCTQLELPYVLVHSFYGFMSNLTAAAIPAFEPHILVNLTMPVHLKQGNDPSTQYKNQS